MPERAGHGVRDPDDYYATTPELAGLICRAVKNDFGLVAPQRILEPSCGGGTFMHAIRATWPDAVAHGIELHEDLARLARENGFDVLVGDTLRAELDLYDLVIGNPPFRHADAFIPLLLGKLRPRGVLAFILRLNYLAGQKRYPALWSRFPPARVYVLPERPGFTSNGSTDATDYMVCAWQEGHVGPAVLVHLDNREVESRWTNPAAFPDPRGLDTIAPESVVVAPHMTLKEWAIQAPLPRVRKR